MADPQGPTETARMSVRPLWCPSMWLIDTQGREPFEQICGDCGIEPHHIEPLEHLTLDLAIEEIGAREPGAATPELATHGPRI